MPHLIILAPRLTFLTACLRKSGHVGLSSLIGYHQTSAVAIVLTVIWFVPFYKIFDSFQNQLKLDFQQFACCNNLALYDEREEKCCVRLGIVIKKTEKCSRREREMFSWFCLLLNDQQYLKSASSSSSLQNKLLLFIKLEHFVYL